MIHLPPHVVLLITLVLDCVDSVVALICSLFPVVTFDYPVVVHPHRIPTLLIPVVWWAPRFYDTYTHLHGWSVAISFPVTLHSLPLLRSRCVYVVAVPFVATHVVTFSFY